MTYIGRLLFGYLLFSLAALAYGQGNDRIALVVGNSAYPKAPLLNPRNDAQAMAALLRQAGFQARAPRALPSGAAGPLAPPSWRWLPDRRPPAPAAPLVPPSANAFAALAEFAR